MIEILNFWSKNKVKLNTLIFIYPRKKIHTNIFNVVINTIWILVLYVETKIRFKILIIISLVLNLTNGKVISKINHHFSWILIENCTSNNLTVEIIVFYLFGVTLPRSHNYLVKKNYKQIKKNYTKSQ